MKSKVITVIIFCLITITITGQQTNTPWFSVKEVAPKVWAIDDHKAVNMYLVEGTDRYGSS